MDTFCFYVLSVRGITISSSQKRGVKRASPVAPIKLGLKMCVFPRETLIQAWLTQFQVRVQTSPKKLPKTAKIDLFWPFLAQKPILNLEESHEILHAHVVEPN